LLHIVTKEVDIQVKENGNSSESTIIVLPTPLKDKFGLEFVGGINNKYVIKKHVMNNKPIINLKIL
jgi:hypothetical protein